MRRPTQQKKCVQFMRLFDQKYSVMIESHLKLWRRTLSTKTIGLLLVVPLLVSCQAFVEDPEAMKERKIATAVETCEKIHEAGKASLAEVEQIQGTFDFLINESDLEDKQKKDLKAYYRKLDMKNCDMVEVLLRYGITEAIRSLKSDQEPMQEESDYVALEQ